MGQNLTTQLLNNDDLFRISTICCKLNTSYNKKCLPDVEIIKNYKITEISDKPYNVFPSVTEYP